MIQSWIWSCANCPLRNPAPFPEGTSELGFGLVKAEPAGELPELLVFNEDSSSVPTVALRKQLVASGEFKEFGPDGMAERFGLPVEYIRMAFDPGYMAIVETLIT